MTAMDQVHGSTLLAIVLCDIEFATLMETIPPCGARLHRGRTLTDVRRILDGEPVDVVLTDCTLTDKHDWKDVLNLVEACGVHQPLIVASRLADEFLWAEVLNLGGFDLLSKPFDPEEVIRVVTSAFREGRRKPVPRRTVERDDLTHGHSRPARGPKYKAIGA